MSVPSSEYSGSPGSLTHSSSSRSSVPSSSKKGGGKGGGSWDPAPSSTETKTPWYSNPNTSLSSTLVQKSKDNVFGRTFTHIFQPVTHFVDSVFKLIQSVGFAISSVGKDAEQKSELQAKSFYALKSSGNSLLRTISSFFNLFTGYQKEIGLSKLAMNPYIASPVGSSRASSTASSRASSSLTLEDLVGLKRVDTAESLSDILGNGGHDTERADEILEILREDLPPSVRGSDSVEGVPPPGSDSRHLSFDVDPDEVLRNAGVSASSVSSEPVNSRKNVSMEVLSTGSAPSRVRPISNGGDSLPSSINSSSNVSGSFGLSGLLREMQPNTSTYKATNVVIGRATNAAMQALGHTPSPSSVTTRA